ncbi:MAG: hypothetical protein K9L30_09695 [Desulfobacterales bacterium]|nr:hypothetical protein [Desulfobacterales bacterium]
MSNKIRNELNDQKINQDNTTLLLKYGKQYNFKEILSFIGLRVIEGVEVVTGDGYGRTFRTENTKGFFTVTNRPEQSALELRIGCSDIKFYKKIYNKVRKMFDLDTDFTGINERFSKDRLLSKGMVNGHVPHLPIVFDTFEFVVRAVLGQQITVKAATTLATRIAAKAALKSDKNFPEGLALFFPNPSELLALDLEGLGITKTRQATLRVVARAILNSDIKLTAKQTFDKFYKDFSALKGIGDWTVNYVAMRGLGMMDSFPAGDLGVVKALSKDGQKISGKEIIKIAEKWRPYRAYAALCLWNL